MASETFLLGEDSTEFVRTVHCTDLSDTESLYLYESLVLKAVRIAIADEDEDFIGLQDTIDLESTTAHKVFTENQSGGSATGLATWRSKESKVVSTRERNQFPNVGNHYCEQCGEWRQTLWISGPGSSKKITVIKDETDRTSRKKGARENAVNKATRRNGVNHSGSTPGNREYWAMCHKGHTISRLIPKLSTNRNNCSKPYSGRAVRRPPSPDSLPIPRFLTQIKGSCHSPLSSEPHNGKKMRSEDHGNDGRRVRDYTERRRRRRIGWRKGEGEWRFTERRDVDRAKEKNLMGMCMTNKQSSF